MARASSTDRRAQTAPLGTHVERQVGLDAELGARLERVRDEHAVQTAPPTPMPRQLDSTPKNYTQQANL